MIYHDLTHVWTFIENKKLKFIYYKQEKTKDIYDCLDIFRQKNILNKGNEWYCNKCKEHVEAEKKMEIYKVPQILIFQLKRFKG